MNNFRGTGVALATPFLPDLSVDTTGLRNLVRHQIAGQVDYLVVLGTTGETATLSEAEKRLVIETIIDENAGQLPIVLGVGGNNTKDLGEQLQKYPKDYSLDGILSVSPYYNKPSQEGIFQHYRYLSDLTDLPIILYNVPPRTSSNMLAETTLRLAEIPNIVAMKEASGKLDQCMEIVRHKPEGFALLSGDDALALPLISLGAEGIISVTANSLPGPFSQMVKAALAGDFDSARQLHYDLLPLIGLNFAEGNPAGVKYQLALQGLCEPSVRLPLVAATEPLRQKMQSAWARLMSKIETASYQ
ncbi:MAG: 4-hydroxy-tetrahydrodipicolinate synthase [Bacteroidota bacterium]